MITTGLLNFGFTIVNGMWALVPAWTIQGPSDASLMSAKYFLSSMDRFAPITELFYIFNASITALGVFVAYKFILKLVDWITNLIP